MQSDYVIHASKGLKESFDNAAGMEVEQFKDARLFNLVTTNEWSEEFTSTEGMSGSKKLAENETPPVLNLTEGRTITLTPDRWGASVEFTETDYEKTKDNTVKIQEYLNRKKNALLVDLKYTFIDSIFDIYNNAFSSSAETLAPDGVELCGAHLTKDGAAWFTNKGTEAMDTGAIETLETYGGAFKDAKGKEMPINFDTIIVKKGGAAAREAKKLFAHGITPATVANVNIYEGEYTIIETPMITSGLYWFAYDSQHPIGLPLYVGVNKAPTMADPLTDKNLSVTFPATAFWKKGINNMPINFYGSTGAA